jgi:YD repeat-containing protein
VTQSYDSSNQLPTATTDGAVTITKTWDSDGRLSTYTDADANVTTYGYDLTDRVTSIADPAATQTITYHDNGENRSLPTGFHDPVAGDFGATYDPDTNLMTRSYPGGIVATYRRNEVDTPVHVDYVKSGATWLADDVTDNIHAETSIQTAMIATQDYMPDSAGRPTNVQSTPSGAGCTALQYGIDADGNNTSLTTLNPNLAGGCTTSGGTTTTTTYDAADRVYGTGYVYDNFSRQTTIPAAVSPTGLTTTVGYYVNGQTNTIASGGVTITHAIDPKDRVRSWNDGTNTHVNHYASDDDLPARVTENASGTLWTRYVATFGVLDAVVTSTGVTQLGLLDLQGDVLAFATPSASSPTFANWNGPPAVYGATATDMSPLIDPICSSADPVIRLIRTYSRNHGEVAHYYLRCGNANFGIRHIIKAKHFGGVVNKFVVDYLIPQTVAYGPVYKEFPETAAFRYEFIFRSPITGAILWKFEVRVAVFRKGFSNNVITAFMEGHADILCWDYNGPC